MRFHDWLSALFCHSLRILLRRRRTMGFQLDHTIVPAHDKEESARFLARILGLEYNGMWGPFAPVKVNETLSLDFDDRRKEFQSHHYAFITSDAEFDQVLQRVKSEGLKFGSGPRAL